MSVTDPTSPPATPPAPAPAPASAGGVLALAVVCVIIAALGGAAGAFLYAAYYAPDESRISRTLAATERARGATAGLAARFADADNDLVADAPEPAKQIDPPELGFSPVAHFGSDKEEGVWKEFVAHLAKVTGKTVKYVPTFSATQQLDKLDDGSVLVLGVNTGAVPAAVARNGFVPAAVPADAEGNFGYEVELLVPADSPAKRPEDVKGKKLTLTNFRSNAGHKAPLVMLQKDYQLLPDRDFDITFASGYDAAAEALAKGEVQVVALPSDLRRRFTKEGKLPESKFRVIARSDRFPPAAYGYRSDLKKELADKVREAFRTFEFKGTGLEAEFAKAGQVKFVPVDFRKDFEYVRKVDEAMARFDAPAGN